MAASTSQTVDVPVLFRGWMEALCSGEGLSEKEAQQAVTLIAEGAVHECQVSAFIALLRAKGESAEELSGFVKAMRQKAKPVALPASLKPDDLVDIVGTGGDGHNTVNISTSAAILAAACGVPVAKHGSVSVSSRSGSADVLQTLGIAMLEPSSIGPCIEACGIAFMFAPLFHPAMGVVAPVRKALKMRTIFNILGPLLNPTGAQRLMLGVYSPAILDAYASALAALGVRHALVVHCGGLDELAPVAEADIREIQEDGSVSSSRVDPRQWMPACDIADLQGGSPEDNAETIRAVFVGGSAADCHVGRTIALNAGAALYVAGRESSIQAGYEAAFAALQSGSALKTLQAWASTSQHLSKPSSSD
ncbi:PAT1 [Symbiodinium sp. KB8]|nr:PAT1 [Symbiodinium sp. KB8]